MSLTTVEAGVSQQNRDGAQNYHITPRVDYRTVLDVEGPLVILDNVKFPK
jgi:hypothetical protein